MDALIVVLRYCDILWPIKLHISYSAVHLAFNYRVTAYTQFRHEFIHTNNGKYGTRRNNLSEGYVPSEKTDNG